MTLWIRDFKAKSGRDEGWSSRPLKIRGRPGFLKNFLRPSGPQFSLQDKGGGAAAPRGPSLDPPLEIILTTMYSLSLLFCQSS